MQKIDLEAVHNTAKELLNEVNAMQRWHLQNNDLTQEGRNKAMQRATSAAKYADNVANLRIALAIIQTAVQDDIDARRREFFPEPATPIAATAAELKAARILKRSNLKEMNLKEALSNMPADPVRTIVAEEAVASGAATQDFIDSLAFEDSVGKSFIVNGLSMYVNGMNTYIQAIEGALSNSNGVTELPSTAEITVTAPISKGWLMNEYYIPEEFKLLPVAHNSVYYG